MRINVCKMFMKKAYNFARQSTSINVSRLLQRIDNWNKSSLSELKMNRNQQNNATKNKKNDATELITQKSGWLEIKNTTDR